MRIAFFTDTYYPSLNGVTTSVSNFAKELREKGHTVYIFAPKVKGRYKDEDPDLIRLPSLRIASKTEPEVYSPTLWPNKEFREMFTIDFDVIHAHGNGPYSVLGYSIAKIKRVPFVMTFHTMFTLYSHYILSGKLIKPKTIEVGLRISANRCKAIFVPSRKMADELVKYGVKKQIHIIPNFLEIERFKKAKPGYLHKLLNLPEDSRIILTVGRVGKEKNLDFILRVLKEISKTDMKTHLVIVGNGPEKDNLSGIANKLGISKRVHFTGIIEHQLMPLAYKDAAVFVFASYTETQGICVLEAAASGIPAVINDDGAFDNMVIDNQSGFLLPLDEKKFAEKITYLLENEEIREEMGKKAVKIATENFSADKIISDLLKIYSQVLKNK